MAVTSKLQSYLILNFPYSKRNYCNDILFFLLGNQSNGNYYYTVCGTAWFDDPIQLLLLINNNCKRKRLKLRPTYVEWIHLLAFILTRSQATIQNAQKPFYVYIFYVCVCMFVMINKNTHFQITKFSQQLFSKSRTI